ncbi:tRNA-specific adenosine deaminase [Candidatus Methanoplasma termitum]|uniref:TadA1 protein n=1 Tax=Candidatus Methanoplasma termitum TaxID=1577791 RepID=A0A0A7LD22_9ARCH|nr:nucleoside deaminase [Candidatus Methanoplasma termitum]AIZ56969.1 tRNA-specific adenosine deaminase [Candidatus Methanoplasma termitum]MCL2333283.1 nucleoside deaminase [Candidatus Methanoplasma sp.]
MDRFMEIAYKEALYGISKKHGGPFGAVIVKDGKVISKAHNQVLLKNDPTAHAEVVAIRKACRKLNTIDLGGCTLYASAKPCPMCIGVIQWSRIKDVFFSGDYEDTKKLNFDDQSFYEDFEAEDDHWEQIDEEHFDTLIQAFESCKNDIKY